MIIVKFIVLFGCISVFSALQTNYCKVCTNHTLCQYKIPGPSAACKLYDNTALLSSQEIQDLVHKINERRNFVAMGHSAILPQAANMKKVFWSTELATIAQRWADQCDPFLLPDREDYCRDLENNKVGQNIGSVVGTSPGLNVKSFVEMWFMQILDYVGTVTYYNQSRDYNTKYFTQLIWAETEFVGCGKVKFYIQEKKMMIVRLVCNFAPKGNIDGKPVYAIGYARTQCADNYIMIPNQEHQGLCNYNNTIMYQKLSQRYPASSLLKILNLSNDSVKREIDPIHSNYKDKNQKRNRQRNQKTRHVSAYNGHDTIRRTSLRKPNMRKNLMQNMTRNMKDDEYLYQNEQGHSRLYHGHEEPSVPIHQIHYFQENKNQNLRKYDSTSKPVYLIASSDHKSYNLYPECTRNIPSPFCCDNRQCTRGYDCCQRNTGCHSEILAKSIILNTICPPARCTSTCPTVCPPLCTTVHNCNTDCICSRGATQCCKNMANMLRSGNYNTTPEFYTMLQESEQYYDSRLTEGQKIKHEKKEPSRLNEHLNDDMVRLNYNKQDRDYVYGSMDSSFRKKRQLASETTLRPFWKFNNMDFENTPQLKSLKYTTLPNRKVIITRKNLRSNIRPITMEPITIRKEDYSNDENDDENSNEEQITEKYLSFDELMYLRKLSDNYMDYNPRRQSGRKQNKKDNDKNKKNTANKGADKNKDKKSTANKGADKNKDKKSTANKGADKNKDKKTTANKGADKNKDKKTTANKGADKNKDKKSTDKKEKDKKDKDKTDKDKKDKSSTKALLKNTVTEKSGTTTEYTANTPFERKKQCTRKLTCTWTALTGMGGNAYGNGSGYDNNGHQIRPIDIGSRTPPGYVEGCTRTSTCTRDFMDRNKMATTSSDSLEGIGVTGIGDNADDGDGGDSGDYCEKRSLKIHKRNSEQKFRLNNVSLSSLPKSLILNKSKTHGNAKTRMKRQEITSSKDSSNVISYADLYYLVLSRLMKSNEAETHNIDKCLCNCSINRRIISSCLFYSIIILNL